MTRTRLFPQLLMAIAGLLLLWACDSGTKESNQTPKAQEAEHLFDFVEASKGLPTSEMWRQGLALVDLNGDGHMDIVAPPPRKPAQGIERPVAWYGNGRGEWIQTPLKVPADIVYNYGDVVVSDFDGDTLLDMGLAMHSCGLKAFKGVAPDKYVDFSQGLPSVQVLSCRAVVAADFNNDGLPDMAALTEGPPKRTGSDGVWVCCRSGEAWECSPIGEGNEARGLFGDQVVTGDVDGDGNTDLAVASFSGTKTLIIWLGDGNGGFTPFNKRLLEGSVYLSVALADMDQDGRDDLVAAFSGFGVDAPCGLKVFLSRPEGFEEMSEGLPQKAVMFAVNACDLDGDGSLEIIGATGAGGLKVFSQVGIGWQEMEVTGLPEQGLKKVYRVYCRDMNGDGMGDVTLNFASEKGKPSGGIRVFFNNSVK